MGIVTLVNAHKTSLLYVNRMTYRAILLQRKNEARKRRERVELRCFLHDQSSWIVVSIDFQDVHLVIIVISPSVMHDNL
jgi:hypothetical protein